MHFKHSGIYPEEQTATVREFGVLRAIGRQGRWALLARRLVLTQLHVSIYPLTHSHHGIGRRHMVPGCSDVMVFPVASPCDVGPSVRDVHSRIRQMT